MIKNCLLINFHLGSDFLLWSAERWFAPSLSTLYVLDTVFIQNIIAQWKVICCPGQQSDWQSIRKKVPEENPVMMPVDLLLHCWIHKWLTLMTVDNQLSRNCSCCIFFQFFHFHTDNCECDPVLVLGMVSSLMSWTYIILLAQPKKSTDVFDPTHTTCWV